jgi:hypothetical protein
MRAYTLQSTSLGDDLLHSIGIERRGRLKEPVIMLDDIGAESKRKFLPISSQRSLEGLTSVDHLRLGPYTQGTQTLLWQGEDTEHPNHLLLKAIIPKQGVMGSPGALLLGEGRWSSHYVVQMWMLPHQGFIRYRQTVAIVRNFHWRFDLPLTFELYWDAKTEHPRPILRLIGPSDQTIDHRYA